MKIFPRFSRVPQRSVRDTTKVRLKEKKVIIKVSDLQKIKEKLNRMVAQEYIIMAYADRRTITQPEVLIRFEEQGKIRGIADCLILATFCSKAHERETQNTQKFISHEIIKKASEHFPHRNIILRKEGKAKNDNREQSHSRAQMFKLRKTVYPLNPAGEILQQEVRSAFTVLDHNPKSTDLPALRERV